MISNINNRHIIGKNESGAILVMAAAMVGVFIIMAALAIDMTLDITSREQAKNYARLSALAAIEAYFESDSDVYATRVSAARAAADRVSGATDSEAGAGNFIISSTERAESTQDSNSPTGIHSGFREGIYYFTEAQEGVNPCSDPYNESPPCFVPMAAGGGSAEEQERVNAFQIEGAMYNSLTTRFAHMFGVTSLLPATVSAIATVVPRHGCFMVDLSHSMAEITHDYDNTTDPYDFAVEWDTGTNQALVPGFVAQWNSMGPTRPNGVPDPKVHYQNDFKVFTPLPDSARATVLYPELHPETTDNPNVSLSNTPINRAYMVDSFRATGYRGPEPLIPVLKGLRAAIQTFKDRRVAGDQICIIFYDNRISWSRTIKLTDEFEKVDEFLDFDLDGDYDPTGANPPSAGMQRMMDHGIFPTYVNGKSFTNMLLVLSEATRQFDEASQSGVPSSNFLVFIGDGLSNCGTCTSFAGSPADVNGDGRINGSDSNLVTDCANDNDNPPYIDNGAGGNSCLPAADLDGDNDVTATDQTMWQTLFNNALTSSNCTAQCSHSYLPYRQAMSELKGFARTELAPNNTPVHVVLVGDHVAPHSIDISDGSGGCMSDNEARVNNLAYTQGGNLDGRPYSNDAAWTQAFDNMGPLNLTPGANVIPFYQVNADMYEVAASTGGIWAPIRVQDSSCTESETRACDPSQRRRTTDPFCRSMESQIAKYMEVIIGQNPYTLTSDE